MRLKAFLLFLLTATVAVAPLSFAEAKDKGATFSNNRVVVVSKTYNPKDTDESLKKYKHKKEKRLTNFEGAEVVFVDNDELEKLKTDNTIQVFEDASIKVTKPKKSKEIKLLQQIPWGVKRVEADRAWIKTTGEGVKVAVVDSGIAKHKDLQKNIKGEFNAIEPGRSVIDPFGHGTHVSGIIASNNNKVGVVGVAPEAELYAVKVLDSFGSGYLSDLVEGIEWCINNGIQIINLSIEIESDLPLLRDSINRALNAGLIVVAAAGNTYSASATFPAGYEGVFSVSAIDETDKIADFSATGKIDFCAPGVDIYSTYINSGYSHMSGTSMAAPHITGVIALMLADLRNDMDNDGIVSTKEVVNIICNCTEDIGTMGYDEIYGYGVLKVSK